MKEGETIKYSGPAQAYTITEEGDVSWETKEIWIDGEFVVDEIHPVEPSAYVWESCIDVTSAGTNDDEPTVIYSITEANYMDYLGLCPDCYKDHGPEPLDCPFNRMVD